MLEHEEVTASGEPSEDVLTGLLESLSGDGLQAVLAEVASLATSSIPDADGASVACLRDGQAVTFAATDSAVRAADEAQYSTQNGPCVEAGLDGQVHLSQHLPEDARWMLDLAQEHGLKIFVDVCWPKNLTFIGDPQVSEMARNAVRDCTRACGNHPALFAISVVKDTKLNRFVGQLVSVRFGIFLLDA